MDRFRRSLRFYHQAFYKEAIFMVPWNIPLFLTLRDRTPIRTLSDRGGALRAPPSISETIIDRDLIFFSGGSCVFLEKISTSTHSGQTAP